mgnify:CR=1 FL=1
MLKPFFGDEAGFVTGVFNLVRTGIDDSGNDEHAVILHVGADVRSHADDDIRFIGNLGIVGDDDDAIA